MKGRGYLFQAILSLSLCIAVPLYAGADAQTIGDVARNFDGTFPWLGKVLIALSYVAGIGFGICSVYKFKQYKDNPTQIPVGTPFVLLAVSVCMVFLPSIISPTEKSFFGTDSSTSAGWFEGNKVVSGLPGSS